MTNISKILQFPKKINFRYAKIDFMILWVYGFMSL